MPPVINVGGSLTGAVMLTLVAWGVRTLRAAHLRRQAAQHKALERRFTRLGRYYSALSPAALHMLIETHPVPHLIIDVRSEEEVTENPLPSALSTATHIPGPALEETLGSREGWVAKLGPTGPPYPPTQTLLVFLSSGPQAARTAAAVAAEYGYERSAMLQPGLDGYQGAASGQVDLQFISRDGLAALLGHTPSRLAAAAATVIDLRRSDERTLYGAIPGSVHLAADQLGAALQAMSPDEFQHTYHFPKPSAQDAVVLHCRTNRRAAWAAQLCRDVGLQRVLVYRQGVYGWRLDASVKAYKAYDFGETPPEPENFQVEAPNEEAALVELQQLGLTSPSVSLTASH